MITFYILTRLNHYCICPFLCLKKYCFLDSINYFLYHISLLMLARFKIDLVQKYYYLLEIISSWFYKTRNISIAMLRDLCFLINLKKKINL